MHAIARSADAHDHERAAAILSLVTKAAAQSGAADLPHYRERRVSSHGERRQGCAVDGLAGVCGTWLQLASWQATAERLTLSIRFCPG